MWSLIAVSGFSVVRVKGVCRESSGFSVPCLVCMGRVFGSYVYPFWFESDRKGVTSGLLSSDGLVFTCGLNAPPPPCDGRLLNQLHIQIL